MDSNSCRFANVNGFNDWKKVYNRISAHENSDKHIDCIIKFCTHHQPTAYIDKGLREQCLSH